MTQANRRIGTSDVSGSAIGLGTWAIGGTGWGGTRSETAIAAIREAMDQGITLIDTAPIYGFGLSEEIVGEAIKGRRGEVVLSTKCGLVWGGDKGDFFFPSEKGPVHKYLGADSIRREIALSLSRLGTDYIDLYHTHFQENVTPVEEVMDTLLDLKKQGVIRAIGISNATSERLLGYLRCGDIACVQESYSMIERAHDRDLFPLCKQRTVGVLAYSPLAMGLLTGRITQERQFGEGDARQGNRRFSGESLSKVNTLLDFIRPIAAAHSVSIAQVVIAWTMHQPNVTHVLCGARNPDQARENAQAGAISLSTGELQAIDHALGATDIHLPGMYED